MTLLMSSTATMVWRMHALTPGNFVASNTGAADLRKSFFKSATNSLGSASVMGKDEIQPRVRTGRLSLPVPELRQFGGLGRSLSNRSKAHFSRHAVLSDLVVAQTELFVNTAT